jgi:hypothetical protein
MAWIANVFFCVVIDLPVAICRAIKKLVGNWWYSHYR